MLSMSPLYRWVSAYMTQVINGLKQKKGKKAYTVQIKLVTVRFMLEKVPLIRKLQIILK